MASNRLRIVSDGTTDGTNVLVGDQQVEGVLGVHFTMAPGHQSVLLTLVMDRVDMHVDGKLIERVFVGDAGGGH
jgi:hypothetical protein